MAAIASWLGVGLVIQLLLFLVVSVVLLVFTRPLAVRFLNKGLERTNVNSLIGETAVVLPGNRQSCPDGTGEDQ